MGFFTFEKRLDAGQHAVEAIKGDLLIDVVLRNQLLQVDVLNMHF